MFSELAICVGIAEEDSEVVGPTEEVIEIVELIEEAIEIVELVEEAIEIVELAEKAIEIVELAEEAVHLIGLMVFGYSMGLSPFNSFQITRTSPSSRMYALGPVTKNSLKIRGYWEILLPK